MSALWNAGDVDGFMEGLDPAVEFSRDPMWPERDPT